MKVFVLCSSFRELSWSGGHVPFWKSSEGVDHGPVGTVCSHIVAQRMQSHAYVVRAPACVPHMGSVLRNRHAARRFFGLVSLVLAKTCPARATQSPLRTSHVGWCRDRLRVVSVRGSGRGVTKGATKGATKVRGLLFHRQNCSGNANSHFSVFGQKRPPGTPPKQ